MTGWKHARLSGGAGAGRAAGRATGGGGGGAGRATGGGGGGGGGGGAGRATGGVQPPERRWSWWGRVIFYYASDVDALHQRALAAGYQPSTSPRDAEWGERFFHLDDPDGHELSFARPLRSST